MGALLMVLVGVPYLKSLLAQQGFSAKMVFNSRGALFFPAAEQHRDQKAPGISYEDEHSGDALAAMLSAGKLEVRRHRAFNDAAVVEILRRLAADPDLAFLKQWRITYQGRSLAIE